MKMRRPHVVPLSRQVVALLRDLEAYTGGQPWLFPNLRKPAECLSITTINRALERMGYGGQFSGHGFRGTASTALNEMGYPSDHIEAQLAHVQGGVRKAYNHAQYLPERRKMMQDWADLIDRLVADQQG
jgi:integrase